MFGVARTTVTYSESNFTEKEVKRFKDWSATGELEIGLLLVKLSSNILEVGFVK